MTFLQDLREDLRIRIYGFKNPPRAHGSEALGGEVWQSSD